MLRDQTAYSASLPSVNPLLVSCLLPLNFSQSKGESSLETWLVLDIMGVPKEEEREKGAVRVSKEILVEKSPNMMKNFNLHIQEAQ